MHELKKNSCGFSLLEILVAFSIAALSLGVLFQIYAKGTTSVILGEEYAQAIIIAESRLADLSVSTNLNEVENSGRENDKYDWEVSIEDYVGEEDLSFTPTMLLKQVEVTVTWLSAGKSRSVNLQSLKPVPAI
jgi:general secretion pathway protein I